MVPLGELIAKNRVLTVSFSVQTNTFAIDYLGFGEARLKYLYIYILIIHTVHRCVCDFFVEHVTCFLTFKNVIFVCKL